MYKVVQLCLPEGCRDELSPVRKLVYHVGHGLPVHRVQRLVDLVKQVEWSRVTFLREHYIVSVTMHHHTIITHLNSEDKSQSHQGLLSSTELVHLSHLGILTRETDGAGDTGGILQSYCLQTCQI